MRKFNRKAVSEITGFKPSRIQFYTDQGIIVPEISNPIGKGTNRMYSAKNVDQIMLIPRLVGIGYSLENIKKIFRRRTFDDIAFAVSMIESIKKDQLL